MTYDLRLGDCLDGIPTLAERSVDSVITDPPAGIGFMGKDWDGDKGGRDAWVEWMAGVMRECLRVLKPGAHALVWALPRTSHWTATAIENAGFEIRDVITHHFGTGFPKSLDVSKAIDKAVGAARAVVGVYQSPEGTSGRSDGSGVVCMAGKGIGGLNPITAPATDAAKQWAGWGTALKPASEHWILARKPLEGTVAANVQAHGTGAINIDASRIEGGPRALLDATANVISGNGRFGTMGGSRSAGQTTIGRFPANVVFTHNHDCPEVGTCTDGCPVAALDGQSGVLESGALSSATKRGENEVYGRMGGSSATPRDLVANSGGASRFFYCAKPARDEKDANRARNPHPTVKSLALMRYLIRMITPSGGVVLDPFAGSGTTAVAAHDLGCRFLGWEQDPDYHAFATQRLRDATAQGNLL